MEPTWLASHEVRELNVIAESLLSRGAYLDAGTLAAIIDRHTEPKLCLDQLRTDQWDIVCGLLETHSGRHLWSSEADRNIEVRWDG